MPSAAAPARRSHAVVLLGTAVVVGLALQLVRDLPWVDVAGTVAYAAAAVALLAVLLPGRGALLPGTIGTALACTVELAQLTELPAAIIERVPVLALLLGTGAFDPVDLAALVAGGALATLLLHVAGTRSAKPVHRRQI